MIEESFWPIMKNVNSRDFVLSDDQGEIIWSLNQSLYFGGPRVWKAGLKDMAKTWWPVA